MVRKILTYGDERLRKISEEIPVHSDVKSLIEDLWDTLYSSPNGVGLAAPQIGINLRAFVIDDRNGFKGAFINPSVSTSGVIVAMDEGCLSIPGLNSKVNRQEELDIAFYDENWDAHADHYTGFISRIVQHEFDHLEGVLWVDHLMMSEQLFLVPFLNRLKKS